MHGPNNANFTNTAKEYIGKLSQYGNSFLATSILLWPSRSTVLGKTCGDKTEKPRVSLHSDRPWQYNGSCSAMNISRSLIPSTAWPNALHSQAVQPGFADPAGALAEAESCEREALAIERKLLSEEHPSIAMSVLDLGWVLQLQNKFAESEALQRESIPKIKKLWGNESRHLTTAYLLLGNALTGQSELVQAMAAYREALNLFEKLVLENRYSGFTRDCLGRLLRDQGKPDEAERLHREALSIHEKMFGDTNSDVLSQVALDLAAQGKLPDAEAMFRQALAIQRKALGNEHPEIAKTLVHLAILLQAEGRLAESETMIRDASVIQRKAIEKTPNSAAARNELAWMLVMSPFDKLRDPAPGR